MTFEQAEFAKALLVAVSIDARECAAAQLAELQQHQHPAHAMRPRLVLRRPADRAMVDLHWVQAMRLARCLT